jgi:hypothetical protein
MKFSFKDTDPAKVRDLIVNALGGRELGKMVSFDLRDDQLVVTISKFGTSTLQFKCEKTKDSWEFQLGQQKIAFAHRAFESDVKSKILKVIESIGGKIS